MSSVRYSIGLSAYKLRGRATSHGDMDTVDKVEERGVPVSP